MVSWSPVQKFIASAQFPTQCSQDSFWSSGNFNCGTGQMAS